MSRWDGGGIRHHGLLGTVVTLWTRSSSQDAAGCAERSVIAEIERLQRVFDRFDSESTLRRWQRHEADPSAELLTVIDLGRVWQARTGGAFNPAVGALVDVWTRAEAAGAVPDAGVLQETVRRITAGVDVATREIDLNAVAKGWIVDRAVDHALASCSVAELVVDAGGDLVHRGDGEVTVGIEDPTRPYDNVPPLMRVKLSNAALATSGGSRRGWTIGGRRYAHIIDPRRGTPIERVASATVIAPDAATADVLATALTVMEPVDGIELVDAVDGAAACLIESTGPTVRSRAWASFEVS